MLDLNYQYRELLTNLVMYPDIGDGIDREYNARTGDYLRRFLTPQILSVRLNQGVPCPRWRRIHPAPALADLLWQLQGTTDLTWLNRHVPYMWGPYVEDGRLPKAYGVRYMWQLPILIEHLRSDPTSRQAYLGLWNAEHDLADGPRAPMPPCPVGLHFRVTHHPCMTLDATVVLRSSDSVIGLPHDLMTFGMLQTLMARSLGYAVGTLHLVALDLHIYECHLLPMRSMLYRRQWLDPILLQVPELDILESSSMDSADRDRLVEDWRHTHRSAVQLAPHYVVSLSR